MPLGFTIAPPATAIKSQNANISLIYGTSSAQNFNTGNIVGWTISYGVTFTAAPTVIITAQTDDSASGVGDGKIGVYMKTAPTTTDFYPIAANETGYNKGNVKIHWMAIGQLA